MSVGCPGWEMATKVHEYELAWQDFVRSGKVASATTEPDLVPEETREYLLYLFSLAHDHHTIERVQLLQRELTFSFVDPIPEQNLHVSIQALELPHRVWTGERDRIIAQSSRALAGIVPVTLWIGGANSFTTAAFLEVYDVGKIRELRARLRQALPDLVVDDPFVRDGKDGWLPHLSVAYYTADRDNLAVIDVLQWHRSLESFDVSTGSVQLVRMSVPTDPLDRWRWSIETTFS
jgi:hypothetical protein